MDLGNDFADKAGLLRKPLPEMWFSFASAENHSEICAVFNSPYKLLSFIFMKWSVYCNVVVEVIISVIWALN